MKRFCVQLFVAIVWDLRLPAVQSSVACARVCKCRCASVPLKVLMIQWMHPVEMRWQFIELFSGVGNISAAFRDAGYATCSFDKLTGSEMDFSTPSGFAFGSQNCQCLWSSMNASTPSKVGYLDLHVCRTESWVGDTPGIAADGKPWRLEAYYPCESSMWGLVSCVLK